MNQSMTESTRKRNQIFAPINIPNPKAVRSNNSSFFNSFDEKENMNFNQKDKKFNCDQDQFDISQDFLVQNKILIDEEEESKFIEEEEFQKPTDKQMVARVPQMVNQDQPQTSQKLQSKIEKEEVTAKSPNELMKEYLEAQNDLSVSESNQSINTQILESEFEKRMIRLIKGQVFLKYGKRNLFSPQKRLIHFTQDLQFLVIRNQTLQIRKFYKTNQIVDTVRDSDTFKKFSYEQKQKCFEIQLRTRALDLQGESEEQIKQFIEAINELLSVFQKNK